MPSIDDDYVIALARRMANNPDAPLLVSAYEPEPALRIDLGYGGEYCGHHAIFEINVDKRIVWCRKCGTILDPYFVIERLGNLERRLAERLRAAQELERREREREEQRQARAKTRRHRYARYSRNGRCATCGGDESDALHTPGKKAAR